MIKETPTGNYRHRLAIVKEGLFSKGKPVLILQQEIHRKGTYYSNDPYDVHGLDVDSMMWVDCTELSVAGDKSC